jgi:cytochrome P450
MTDQELLTNCLSLLLGAMVTTSHLISATIIALTEVHGGEGRWPDSPSMQAMIKEALRLAVAGDSFHAPGPSRH